MDTIEVAGYAQELPPSLRSFADGLLCTEALHRSFEAVVKTYRARDYTFEEFCRALQSLQVGARTEEALLSFAVAGDSEHPLYGGRRGEPLILYLDPTCGECARVVDVVREAAKGSPRFPTVIGRLLPSHHPDSIRAATSLEIVRERDPAAFPNALIETLHLVPEGKATLDVVLRPYIAEMPLADSPESLQAMGRWSDDVRPLANFELGAPFGVYRGRRIARYSSAKIPFDTLRDTDSLLLAIAAIDIADGDTCAPRSRRGFNED